MRQKGFEVPLSEALCCWAGVQRKGSRGEKVGEVVGGGGLKNYGLQKPD